MLKQKSVYTFDAMIASLRQAMERFPDGRTGKNIQYDTVDAVAGAFSVFFTQCPSFLAHQKLLEQKHGLSNAKTLFGMQSIPSDNQIRNLLDSVNPSLLSPVFWEMISTVMNHFAVNCLARALISFWYASLIRIKQYMNGSRE